LGGENRVVWLEGLYLLAENFLRFVAGKRT